jgi:hypothetical protein
LSLKYSLFLCLKCLLASCLTPLRLSSFTSLGSCSHCGLAYFLRSTNFEHFSPNHNVRCFDSQYLSLSWEEILKFSLILPQVLLMSPFSSKFSGASDVFSDCNLILFFNFLFVYLLRVLSLHVYLLCSSFALCQSLPNFCNYEIVVSNTVSPSESSTIKST